MVSIFLFLALLPSVKFNSAKRKYLNTCKVHFPRNFYFAPTVNYNFENIFFLTNCKILLADSFLVYKTVDFELTYLIISYVESVKWDQHCIFNTSKSHYKNRRFCLALRFSIFFSVQLILLDFSFPILLLQKLYLRNLENSSEQFLFHFKQLKIFI